MKRPAEAHFEGHGRLSPRSALVAAQVVDDELRHEVLVAAGRLLREVEHRDHHLERVRRRGRAASYLAAVDGEDRLGAVPVDGVGVQIRDVEVEPGRGEVLGEGGVAAEDPAYAWTWAGRGPETGGDGDGGPAFYSNS